MSRDRIKAFKLNLIELAELDLIRLDKVDKFKGDYEIEDFGIFVELYRKDDGFVVLSCTGEFTVLDSNNYELIYGSASQNLSDFKLFYGQNKFLDKVIDTWDKYHNNDINPGTPKQMDFLRELSKKNNVDFIEYNTAVDLLKEEGIYDDNGYKYGHSFFRLEIPEEVIEDIMAWEDQYEEYLNN